MQLVLWQGYFADVCQIDSALSPSDGQGVSPATHISYSYKRQRGVGVGWGEGGDIVASGLRNHSPFLAIPRCLIATVTVSPTWVWKDDSFPVLPCYFKNRTSGESVSSTTASPHPARLLTHGCDQCWLRRKTSGCCCAQALLCGSRGQGRQLKHHTSPQTNLTTERSLFRSGSLCTKEDDSREGSCRGDKPRGCEERLAERRLW